MLGDSSPDIVYSTSYISFEYKTYDYSKRIATNEMTSQQAAFSFTKFSVFSTNLQIDNLRFYTNVTTNDIKDILIRFYDDSDKAVTIDT